MRIPEELHAEFVEIAKRENRSLHSQMIEAMETYIDSDKLRRRMEETERVRVHA
jgi:hypothetical protein